MTTGTNSTTDPKPQGNSLNADTPATPHPAYVRTRFRRKKCRELFEGSESIWAGEEDYLPRFAGESDDSYEFRLKLCAVFNGYQRTVKASVGLILEKEPQLGDDMPASLKTIAEDFDLRGTHLSVYADKLATDGVIDGYAGTFVDFPVVDDPSTTSDDDEQRLGLRPYAWLYLANDILQVRWGKIDGVIRKTLVVLREVTEEVRGDFKIVAVTRYRVYRHTKESGVTWELWKSDESNSVTTREIDPRPMKGKQNGQRGAPLTRIPFSLFAPGDEVGPFEYIPPLENLADLNIEHHQVKTGIRNLEMLAFVPTQVRIGAPFTKNADGSLEYPPIELGPRAVIEAPKIEGVPRPVYWHQPDIGVLEPGNRSLQDIKSDMGAAGLAFLTPDKRAAETAEAKRIDNAAQKASVSTFSRKLQDHLEEVFQFLGEFTGETSGSITMNRDFENTVMDAGMVSALSRARAEGNFSLDTVLMLFERGRVLPEGFDRVKEIDRILREGTLPPEPSTSTQGDGGGE